VLSGLVWAVIGLLAERNQASTVAEGLGIEASRVPRPHLVLPGFAFGQVVAWCSRRLARSASAGRSADLATCRPGGRLFRAV